MFWKFNLISTSHIETILEKENVTLQELMNEEDILQECKAQNKSLVEFLINPEIMAEMVNLVISEPPDDVDEKLRYKYSNIATELLTSDVPLINESLANDKGLLNKLYSFLESDKPLNPLLASFFSKTIGILISRKTETTFEFLQTKDFVNQIMSHLRTSAIMDLLLRLVTCPENAKLRLDILNWLNQQRTVHRLTNLIDPGIDEERHCNASQALCDIIRMARERHNQMQEKLESDPLLQTIESAEAIAELLYHMFNGNAKNESALVNGILVLLTLLEVKKSGLNSQQQQIDQSSIYFRSEAQEIMTPQDEERLRQRLALTVTAILPRVKDFHHLLINPPKKQPISTTVGTLDPPLGSTRIHLSRLISALLFANVHAVNVELVNLGTMKVLLDLFFQYSWNNFLHTQVEQCIGIILSNNPTEDEEGKPVHPLLVNLFTECRLINRILDAWEENEKEESKVGGHRRGYMGHLTATANHVVQNLEKGPNCEHIEQRLKELPEDVRGKWDTFVSEVLSEVNKKNLVTLVGAPNLQFKSEDYEEANPFPHETALQQAFSDYQMQQMTSNFIDQFGFDDDEFGEHEENVTAPLERLATVNFNISAEEDARREMFEQACNERIQPLDNADSDEDIWDDKEHEVILSTIVEARPGMDSRIASRTSRVGSDKSTDSEGEDDSKPTPVLCSTPALPGDEMRMEVDQGDGWAANFDAIPMDTGNPWDSPSQTEAKGEPAMSAASQDSNWADFKSFSAFSESSSFSSSGGNDCDAKSAGSAPVAMETSEDAYNFKIIKKDAQYIDGTTKATDLQTRNNDGAGEKYTTQIIPPSVDSRQDDVHVGNGSTRSPKSSDDGEVASEERPCPSRDVHQVDDSSSSVLKRESFECRTEGKAETPSITSKGKELAENFDYLLTSGLIRTSAGEPTVDGGNSSKNGPDETGEANDREKCDQRKMEETRAKALEACEQFASTVGIPSPNGPV